MALRFSRCSGSPVGKPVKRKIKGSTKEKRRREGNGEKGRAYMEEDVGEISGREARDRAEREREKGRKRRVLSSEGLWWR